MNAQVTAFSEACEWTGARDDERESWLKARTQLLTASDIAAIMGEDPRRDVWDVYADKTATMERSAIDPDISDPRFWGSKLEQPIAQILCDYYKWDMRRGGYLLRSLRHPLIGCTLDCEILRSSAEGWLPYQGKTSRIMRGWSAEDGDLPLHILIQCQVELLVTGAPRNIAFALLQGCEPVLIPVEPFADFQALIVEQCDRFWEYVKSGDPPPVTARSARGIARVYPNENGEVIRLPADSVAWTKRIQEIAKDMAALKNEDDELRNRLRATIGEATFGELEEPVGGKGRWKYAHAKGYWVERHYVEPSRRLVSLKGSAQSETRIRIAKDLRAAANDE